MPRNRDLGGAVRTTKLTKGFESRPAALFASRSLARQLRLRAESIAVTHSSRILDRRQKVSAR